MFKIIFLLLFLGYSQFSTTTQKNLFVQLDNAQSKIIEQDLYTYGYLNKDSINTIMNNIKIYSFKYKIPIGLLHSIFRIESEYKFWVKHENDYAVGIGGVVWKSWKNKLINHNIVKSKQQLRYLNHNIEATAYILRFFVDEIKHNKNDTYIIDDIIKRYYGTKNSAYHNKMKIVTSDLWLKRINKQLLKN